MRIIYTYKLSNHSNVFLNHVKIKCVISSEPNYFVNMVRNTVKNAVLDLYILLKSALKMQEMPFLSPQIEKFPRKACSRTAIEFSGYVHGWLRSDQMSGIRKFQLCRPPGKWQRYVTAAFVQAIISNGYKNVSPAISRFPDWGLRTRKTFLMFDSGNFHPQ